MTIAIVNDNETETDREDMDGALSDAFEILGNPDNVFVGGLGIYTILAIRGENKFVGPVDAFEGTPLEAVPHSMKIGFGGLEFYGSACDAESALEFLEFDDEDDDDDEYE